MFMRSWIFVVVALAQTSIPNEVVPAEVLTETTLNRRAAEIARIVERHAGRKFQSVPAVRIVDTNGMLDALVDDVDYGEIV